MLLINDRRCDPADVIFLNLGEDRRNLDPHNPHKAFLHIPKIAFNGVLNS